jgi:hypothetical protein
VEPLKVFERRMVVDADSVLWSLSRMVVSDISDVSEVHSASTFYLEGKENFLCFTAFRLVLGPTKLPIQWVPGVKLPVCEADHSSTSSKIKEWWSYTPIPPYVFMARYLIN